MEKNLSKYSENSSKSKREDNRESCPVGSEAVEDIWNIIDCSTTEQSAIRKQPSVNQAAELWQP